MVPLDSASIQDAYRRWANVYDALFGGVSARARQRVVDIVNGLPGTSVLEVGVGTGLSLPQYVRDKRVTGIDLSASSLAHERYLQEKHGLTNLTLHQGRLEEIASLGKTFDFIETSGVDRKSTRLNSSHT